MEIRKDVQLLTTDNHKTVKGEVMGVKTLVLYLSPYKDNSKGKNLCPKASLGCSKACLFNSGNARFDKVQLARRNKTEWFLEDRESFVSTIITEIDLAIKKYSSDWIINIRLNGTSDIVWEHIYYGGKNIFEYYPNVNFYDYTKISTRFNKQLPKNYHLTFSRSEDNMIEALKLLKQGVNVAMVFNKLPQTYLGFTVINGDDSDVRTQDPKGVIVGLRYKNATGRGANELNKIGRESGFIIMN